MPCTDGGYSPDQLDEIQKRLNMSTKLLCSILTNLESKNKLGGQSKFPRVLKGKNLNDWMAFLDNYKKVRLGF